MSLRRSKIPKPISLISLIILIILIPLIVSFLQNAGKVEAAWVDDNFSYRNAIPITSHTAAENNVYISVTLDTSASGQFQSDCGDLRFTTVGGDILPYYIVSGCVSASTVVHVFFKSMPAGAQTLYYYYGNPSAANGFSSADFSTVASSYAVGSVAAQEKGGAPIAYWKFDEGTGATTKDSSSNGKNGTISGATWKPESECLSGKCLYFDGNDTVTNSSFGFIPTTGTISLWQKTPYAWADAPGANDLWLAQIRNSDTTSYIAFENYTPGDSLQFKYYHSSTYQTNQGITPAFSAASWHQITMTFETNSVKLYVDGVLRSTDTSATMLGSALDYLVAGYQYTGYIDELKVYNYVQSLAQIKSDFKSRGTAKGSSVSLSSRAGVEGSLSNGLVGYWKTDEATWSGTASEVIDSSGNANHGTAQGTVGGKAYPTTGKFGNGGFFDGIDDSVSIPSTVPITTNNEITVTQWYKPAGSGDPRMVNRGWCSAHGWLSHKSYGFGVNDATGCTAQYWASYGSLTNGQWYFLVGVFDGQKTYGYRDGNLITTTNAPNVNLNSNNYSMSLMTGNSGQIDEVRIYNRALSPREVRDLYNWAPGPVGYWNFEEKTGQTTNDISGNGLGGTLGANSSVSTDDPSWSEGKYGGGLSFDGGDYVIAPDNSYTNFRYSDFTWGAWIKTTTTQLGYIIHKKDPSNNDVYGAYIYASGSLRWIYQLDGSNYNFDGVKVINDGKWHYVSMVYKRGTGTTGYIDGVVDASGSAPVGDHNPTGNNLYIGSGTGGQNFIGSIDDVKIYNYARTQKQIVEDMNAGHPIGGSPVGSQVAYYKLDEGYGTSAQDSGPNNFTATLYNTPTWSNNGKFGKALDFDPTSSEYLLVANTSNRIIPSGNTAFAISMWINPDSVTPSTVKSIAVNETYTVSGFRYGIRADSKIEFWSTESGGTTDLISSTVFSTNNWYYIVMAYDGSTAKLYINGKLEATDTTSSIVSNTNNITIANAIGGKEFFDGKIDEIKFYTSALTEDEIKLDYNRGQALVLGNTGDASSSAGAIYCQPGSSDTCNPPVGEWNFNENGGASTFDTSGNGNTGTITGATWNAIGKTGSALDFNGSSNNVQKADAGSSDPLRLTGGSLTLEAWVNPNTVTGERKFIDKRNQWNGLYGYSFFISGTDMYMEYGNGSAYTQSSKSLGSAFNANAWHHVAVTLSGTTITYYLDGRSYGTNTGVSGIAADTTAFSIGYSAGRGMGGFSGKIDSVKVFDYARNASQIALDYNQGKPVGWWKLDECQGVVANDSAGLAAGGSSNNGTITIGATGTQTAVGTCTTSGTAWYNGVTGKFNSSLNFDGTDDQIQASISNIGFQTIHGPSTVSLWFNPSALTGTKYIFSDNCFEWGFYHNGSTIYGAAYNSVSGGSISTGQWYHAVVTHDHPNGLTNTVIKLYINGIQKGQTTWTYSTENGYSDSPYYIGDDNCTTDRNFSGQIDDVRIFNYALTASQVKSLFNGGAAVKFGPVTGSP